MRTHTQTPTHHRDNSIDITTTGLINNNRIKGNLRERSRKEEEEEEEIDEMENGRGGMSRNSAR